MKSANRKSTSELRAMAANCNIKGVKRMFGVVEAQNMVVDSSDEVKADSKVCEEAKIAKEMCGKVEDAEYPVI